MAPLSVRPTSGFVLFKIGHLTLHEFVEERYGEGGLAMALTRNHALIDQLLTHSRYGRSLDAEHVCDVAGLVRTRSELRHRAKIFLLELGQTVEAHAEEVGVQVGDDAGRGFLNMGAPDPASSGGCSPAPGAYGFLRRSTV